jgi:hypothetical protein
VLRKERMMVDDSSAVGGSFLEAQTLQQDEHRK